MFQGPSRDRRNNSVQCDQYTRECARGEKIAPKKRYRFAEYLFAQQVVKALHFYNLNPSDESILQVGHQSARKEGRSLLASLNQQVEVAVIASLSASKRIRTP